METYILRENVLSDNILLLANENEIFKGGFVAILKEYTYKNAWSDDETKRKFRKRETLFKYLNKNYPEVEIYN